MTANHTRRNEARQARREAGKGKLFHATHRWARMSETKVRLDADVVRGLPINQALEQLQFSNRRGASMLRKVLRSALGNAEQAIDEGTVQFDVDDLFVKDVQVNKGPVLKRWMTRSRGTAYPIHKHTCHIDVTLGVREGGKEGGGEGASAATAKKSGRKAMASAK